MPHISPVEALREGIDTWKWWRAETLNESDVLDRPSLEVPDLSGEKLSELDLDGFDLSRADLHSANLSRASLNGADLTGANLCGANLQDASLLWAHLVGAKLSGSNLSGAVLGGSFLLDIDLGDVKGLESVRHVRPSVIGIDTFYRSKGNIPEVFLRGAGVPEPFIVNMRTLVAAMEPIQFYSCFISYSSKDEEFVERLYADLQKRSVRCWFAPEEMKIGDRIRPRIDEAIRRYDKLLLVLTECSMKSAWVEKEVETAFEEERKQGRMVLFPIRLDDAVLVTEEAWAADIRRTRHIGDFRGWRKHDRYEKAFERLIRDLKA